MAAFCNIDMKQVSQPDVSEMICLAFSKKSPFLISWKHLKFYIIPSSLIVVLSVTLWKPGSFISCGCCNGNEAFDSL